MLTILPATIKANDAHPISSIFLNDKIKINKLSKYLFYGNFCNIEKEEDLLSGETKIKDAQMCDVNESVYMIHFKHWKIPKEIPIDYTSEVCFRIIDYNAVIMAEKISYVNWYSKGAELEFKNNCNKLTYDINGQKYLKEIRDEKVNKNYSGKTITVYGEKYQFQKEGAESFSTFIRNNKNEFWCDYSHYKHKSEKVLDVLRAIKDIPSINVSCHGRVKAVGLGHIYKGYYLWQIDASDMDIIE